MQNPMLQALKSSQVNSNLNQIKQMMNIIRSSGNPQAMLQSMIQSNPQMKQVMDIIDQSGGDPKAAFYKMAKEKGVNPEEVIAMLK